MPINYKDDLQMLFDCAQRKSKLTTWERNFIESLQIQTKKGFHITGAQGELLDEIWVRVMKLPTTK